MALEKIEGYLVRCDKCGAYLGDETDWVLQVEEIDNECEINDWFHHFYVNENNIIEKDIYYCPKCKNNNKK